MKIRDLEEKDALLMLEWMHDEEVLKGLDANKFRNNTLEDCLSFIRNSKKDKENVHKAIVDDADEYVGTVSLKHIDRILRNAEFAIVLRSSAQGNGYGRYAMNEIMGIAFEELDLNKVYWSVLSDNMKAIRLYDGGGYESVDNIESLEIDGLHIGDSAKCLFYQACK